MRFDTTTLVLAGGLSLSALAAWSLWPRSKAAAPEPVSEVKAPPRPSHAASLSAAELGTIRGSGIVPRLEDYDVDPHRGFLRTALPVARLADPVFAPWEQVMSKMSALLLAGQLRATVERITSPFPIEALERAGDPLQWRRAMLLLSMLSHGYIFQGADAGLEPVVRLPAVLAVPWVAVATKLELPPILLNTTICYSNYELLDPRGPTDVSNLSMLNLFLGSSDENWFFTVTAEIEAVGSEALDAILEAQTAILTADTAAFATALARLHAGIRATTVSMRKMFERCMPVIFFKRIRLFLAGWRDNAAFPDGLLYEGVTSGLEAYRPTVDPATGFIRLKLYGGSAAQSSLVQTLDAALRVRHGSHFLSEMRMYCAKEHRAFTQAVLEGPSLPAFALASEGAAPGLVAAFDACVDALVEFRNVHIQIVTAYILQQAPAAAAARGTGGTSILPFLQGSRDETRARAMGSGCTWSG